MLTVASLAIWRNAVSPYWLDEVFTGSVSCQDSFAAMMPLITHDVHPVLYHILIHLLFEVTGCHLWMVRVVSVVASLLGACLLIRATARLDGNVFVAAALTLGNPGFWTYATEARAYGLLFLAGSGVVSFGLSQRRSEQFQAIAFALLGGLLHYFASFLFVVLFAIAIWGQRPAIRSRIFWIAFFAAGCLLAIYYFLQIGDALAVSTGLSWTVPPTAGALFVYLPVCLFGNLVSAIAVLAMMLLPMFVRIPARRFDWRGPSLILLFVGFALAMFGVSCFSPVFVYRYMHFLSPALVLGMALSAGNVETTIGKPGNPSAAKAVAGLIVAFLVFNVSFLLMTGTTDRTMEWDRAMATMDCTAAKPCGFVLDAPGIASFTPGQYDAMANFLAAEKGSFMTIQPEDMAAWVKAHPGGQILYVVTFSKPRRIEPLIHTVPLACRDFRVDRIGAMACRSEATRASP